MTQASLQIDFRPQPRGMAVVTSAPISSIAGGGRYAAFQDLIDGYASSFAKVLVVSPSGESAITVKKPGRVTWFSGPRRLSPMNGLWWAAFANRHELRNVDLVRTFGPRAGIVGRALSRFSNAPHVSSADDLASNSWRDKNGLRAIVPGIVNRLGVLKADVVSATLDWELEYLAETGFMGDLMLGSRGLPTGIYTPVSTTDPDRHPVVLWAGKITGDDSVSLVAEVASSTRKMIPNVEFIVVAEGDAADRLKSTSTEQGLPVTVASYEEVEPLVDLIGRTWVCVTVPSPRKNTPYGLAMLALSAGKPLISVGDLGENHGFQNHLNYIRVDGAESEGVAYGLQLLRNWSSFALRIGSAGQRLVEERYSTRSVGLVEGGQLARIAADLSVNMAMSDGARALQEFARQRSSDVESPEEEGKEEHVGGAEHGPVPETAQGSAPEAEEGVAAGFDLVAAAIASANGETLPVGEANDEGSGPPLSPTGPDATDQADAMVGADMIAALFDGGGVSAGRGDSSDQVETIDDPGAPGQDAIPPLSATGDDQPEAAERAPSETDDSGALGHDVISALFTTGEDQSKAAAEPAVSASDGSSIELAPTTEIAFTPEMTSPDEDEADDGLPQIKVVKINISDISPGGSVEEPAVAGVGGPAPDNNDASGSLGQDAITALFAAGGEDHQADTATETVVPDPTEEAPGALDQDAITALFAAGGEDHRAA